MYFVRGSPWSSILLPLVGAGLAGLVLNGTDDAASDDTASGDADEGAGGSGGDGADDGPDSGQDNGGTGDIVLASGVKNPQGSNDADRFTGIAEGEVRGREGDDSFEIDAGYGAQIEGGRGDDTIRAVQTDASEFYGGEGNDDISFDTGVFDGAAAYGGKGDDRFDLEFEVGKTLATVSLRGGGGDDTFDLGFTSGADDDSRTVILEDFSPKQDSLTVRIGDFTSADLIEDANGEYIDLVMRLDDQSATLRLVGNLGLTLQNDGSGILRVTG